MFSRVGINLPKGGLTEHTATAFSTGEVPKVVVFGGHNGAYHTNELAILSTDAPGAATSDGWGWEPLTVIGRGPSPRSGHTATPLDDDGSSVLFFGGEYTTVGRKYYATTDVLETSTLTWRPLDTVGDEPRARAHHAAAYIGEGRVLVFGGCSSYGGTLFLNDMHELNCARGEWRAWGRPAGSPETSESEGGDFVPAPRMGHTLSYSSEMGGALLFGGEDGETSFNDVALFETGVRAWRPLQLSGMAPVPRAGHTATLVSPSRLYVFGGRTRTRSDAGARARARGAEFRYLQDVAILDLTTLSFSQPALSSRLVPAPRAFHTATSLVGADGVPYVLILGGRGDVRLPFADGFILDVALLAGVQDYAEGYGLLATQLQSARIEAAKAIDGREAAEQAAAEALDDGAAAARDADAAADAAAKARSEARSEAARVEALSAALREAQAALAEQRAALAQATETAARLSDDRAEDARAGQRAIDQAREEAQAKWERSEARLEGARAELEEAKAKLASWEEEENRRHLALRQKAAGADKAIAEAELAKREAELAQQRAAAVSEAMMREHAREIAAAEARTQAAQARADAAAASAAEGGIGAAERARAAAVEITTLRTQLAHALSLEQAAQLRLREAQAARGAEAAELRAGITAAAAEADEARAAFTAARSEAGEALAQLGRELDAAQARVAALDEGRESLVAGWAREREALVARIEQLTTETTAGSLAAETSAAGFEAAQKETRNAKAEAESARKAVSKAELALDAARRDMAAIARTFVRELSAIEQTLEYVRRTNHSLARAKAEAEARASAIEATMRGRLEEVTRALSEEAKFTQELLVGEGGPSVLARPSATRLTVRSTGWDAGRQNADAEQHVAVSPGVAVPRPVGYEGAFTDH